MISFDPKPSTAVDILSCRPGAFLLKLPARHGTAAVRWLLAGDAEEEGALHVVFLTGEYRFGASPLMGNSAMVLVAWDGPVLVELDEEQDARDNPQAGNLLIADDGIYMVVNCKGNFGFQDPGYLSLSDFMLRSKPPEIQGIFEKWKLRTAPKDNLPSMPLITCP